MFQDCGDYTEIPSTWGTDRSIEESSCQTELLKTEDRADQAVDTKHVQVQTDPEPEPPPLAEVEVNYDSLLAFLNRVTPTVLDTLDKASRSRAFHNYKLTDDDDGVETQLTLKYQLQWKDHKKLQVQQVSWSATGATIVVAYASSEHPNWCEHKSAVALWHILRRDFNCDNPTRLIDVDGCVTAISFHPSDAALLAVAFFSGEVQLWSLREESGDHLLATSGSNVLGHIESVSRLRWVKGLGSKPTLLSAGLDGKVLIWRMDQKNRPILHVDKGFSLYSSLLPRNVKPSSSQLPFPLPVIDATFPHDAGLQFVVALEGGLIAVCDLEAQNLSAVTPLDPTSVSPLVNPLSTFLDPHPGRVSCVAISPHLTHALLSTGSEGEVRLYSLLIPPKPQVTQLCNNQVVYLAWSPSVPGLYASVDSIGQLVLTKLSSKGMLTVVKGEDMEKSVPTCLEFNNKEPSLLAIGTTDGSVQVWKLPRDHCRPDADSMQQLIALTHDMEI